MEIVFENVQKNKMKVKEVCKRSPANCVECKDPNKCDKYEKKSLLKGKYVTCPWSYYDKKEYVCFVNILVTLRGQRSMYRM